jgi:hypothetical protein
VANGFAAPGAGTAVGGTGSVAGAATGAAQTLGTAGTQPIAAVPQAGGGGLLGLGATGTGTLLQAGGKLISGLAGGLSAGKTAEAQMEGLLAKDRYDADRMAANYGYANVYATDAKGRTIGGAPISQTQNYAYSDLALKQAGVSSNGDATARPMYQIVNGRVVRTLPPSVAAA